MNFNVRPSRSMSSTNIGYSGQQNIGRKKIIVKKQSEYNSHAQGIKQINNQQSESKKNSNMKTPYKGTV